MATNRTFTMLKPDAVANGYIGAILEKITAAGFRIVAMKMTQLTKADAEAFYAIHAERPFFSELVEYMTSGPVILQVLEGEDAVENYRNIMGATNPENAEEGTIRKLHALNIQENSVHGSDSQDNAEIEINYFFDKDEIIL